MFSFSICDIMEDCEIFETRLVDFGLSRLHQAKPHSPPPPRNGAEHNVLRCLYEIQAPQGAILLSGAGAAAAAAAQYTDNNLDQN